MLFVFAVNVTKPYGTSTPANFVFGNVGGTLASGSNMRKPTPITRL